MVNFIFLKKSHIIFSIYYLKNEDAKYENFVFDSNANCNNQLSSAQKKNWSLKKKRNYE
jgi:hypothetical protein